MECAEYDANFNLVIPYNKVANAQTAYDVDAVCKKMEEKYLECICKNNEPCEYPETIGCCYDRAVKDCVEIARNGGKKK